MSLLYVEVVGCSERRLFINCLVCSELCALLNLVTNVIFLHGSVREVWRFKGDIDVEIP